MRSSSLVVAVVVAMLPFANGAQAADTPAGSVSGTVTGPGGSPLSGICVQAYDGPSHQVGGAGSQPDGSYTITNVRAGAVRVAFFDCAENGLIPQWYRDQPSYEAAEAITVAAGQPTSGIDAQLALGAGARGTVTRSGAAPLGGVCVDAFDTNNRFRATTTTDGDGAYVLTDLPEQVKLQYYDCAADDADDVVAQWYSGRVTIDAAEILTLVAGQTRGDLDVQLAPGGRIAGTVTRPDGTPLVGVCVDAYDTNALFRATTRTAAGGSYLLTGLPATEVRLEFSDCGDIGVPGEWYADQATFATATPIAVAAGKPVVGVAAQLGPAPTPYPTPTPTAAPGPAPAPGPSAACSSARAAEAAATVGVAKAKKAARKAARSKKASAAKKAKVKLKQTRTALKTAQAKVATAC